MAKKQEDDKFLDSLDLEILKELKQDLICGGCINMLRPNSAIFKCNACQKLFCSNCHGVPYACGLRIHRYASVPNDAILHKTLKIFNLSQCKFKSSGCQFEGKLQLLEQHEKSCLFRAVTCPILNCTRTSTFLDLIGGHMKAFKVLIGK